MWNACPEPEPASFDGAKRSGIFFSGAGEGQAPGTNQLLLVKGG